LVSVDLALIGGALAPEQWFGSVLQEFSRGLENQGITPTKSVRSFWLENQQWAPAYRFTRGVRDLLLDRLVAQRGAPTEVAREMPTTDKGSEKSSPAVRLILAVDEIDKVRDFAGLWSDDFFGAVRGFYEKGEFDPVQRQVGFLLIGVAPPSELVKDSNSTPFNIGGRIVLNDFSRAEARRLEQGFVLLGQTPAQASALLDAAWAWTSGHPYLTQRLCYQAALMMTDETKEGSSRWNRAPRQLIAEACRTCFLDPGIGSNCSDDNLRNVHLQLTKRLEDDRYVVSQLRDRGLNEGLLEEGEGTAIAREKRKAAVLRLYARVLRGKHVRDDYRSNPWVGYLHFSGIVRSDHGRLKVRNRLYEDVFSRRWVLENMPGSFRRAELKAFIQGVLITVCFALLAFVSGWQFYRQRREARLNEADRDLRTAQTALRYADQVSTARELIQRVLRVLPERQLLKDTYVGALSRDSLEKTSSEEHLPPYFAAWKVGARAVLGPPGASLKWLDFSSDGRCAAGMYQDAGFDRLTVKRLDDGAEVVSRIPCCRAAVAFDFPGKRCAYVTTNGTVRLVRMQDGRTLATCEIGVPQNPLSPHRIQFNPNPRKPWMAMTSGSRTEVFLWDLERGQILQPALSKPAMAIRDLAWDSEGNQLAIANEFSSRIDIWDVSEGPASASERSFSSDARGLSSICFLPGGRILAGLGGEGVLYLWKTDGSLVDKVELKEAGWESRVAALDDGTVGLLSTNLLQSWHFEEAPIVRTVPIGRAMPGEIVSFELDPSGYILLVAGSYWLRLVDMNQGKNLGQLPFPSAASAVWEARFTPKDGDLLVAREDALLWCNHEKSPSSGLEHLFSGVHALPRARGIRAAAISSDQRQLALAHPSRGNQGPHLDLVDISVSAMDRLPPAPEWRRWLGQKIELTDPQGVDRLSFSPDGSLLLGYLSTPPRLLAWGLEGAAVSKPFQVDGVFDFCFAPDGSWLFAANRITNQCWAVKKGELRKEAFGLPRPYRTAIGSAMSIASLGKDELLCAEARSAESIQLIELNPRAHVDKVLTEFTVPGGARIEGLRLSQDASRLAALTERDGNYAIQLWDLEKMNRFFAKASDAPLFRAALGAGGTPPPTNIKFDVAQFEHLDTDPQRIRTFQFETLERLLRDLARFDQPIDARPGIMNSQSHSKLLSETAEISRKAGELGWEAYFLEQMRLVDEGQQ
jgi:WD40 repeat protein